MQEAQTMFTRQMHETKKRTDVEKYPFAKKPWGMSQPENWCNTCFQKYSSLTSLY